MRTRVAILPRLVGKICGRTGKYCRVAALKPKFSLTYFWSKSCKLRSRLNKERERLVQINSSTNLSSQLQVLENSALGQYQGGPSFADMLQQTSGSSSSTTNVNIKSGGDQLTGTFQTGALIAVGTVGANGQTQLYPQQQIDQEYAAVDRMGQTTYSNALQNFLTLSQQADAASPSGHAAGTSTYTDRASFVGDNGMISTVFNTNLTLTQA
jgi:hypothetical protein